MATFKHKGPLAILKEKKTKNKLWKKNIKKYKIDRQVDKNTNFFKKNLSSMLLHTTSDVEMMKKMEIKFDPNENIELNLDSIEEQQDANWCRSYWNLLIILIICDYDVEKK